MKKLTVVDFFCGAGGFSEGFRQAGCSIVLGVDIWKPAISTFQYNFPKSQVLLKDVGRFSEQDIHQLIPNADIIIGSPPCQLFSTSNNCGKVNKTQGIHLFKSFLKIIVLKRDTGNLKAWFMENVPNSVKFLKQRYSYFELGLSKFAKKNNLNPKSIAIELNQDKIKIFSAIQFGVAQNRKRAFIGEIVKTNCFPKIDDFFNTEQKTLRDVFRNIPAPNHGKKNTKVKDPNYKSLSISACQITDHFYDTGIYEMQWRDCLLKKNNHAYMGVVQFPENLDKPSRTVTTGTGYSREALIYRSEIKRKGDGEYREPTVRELSVIMSFPLIYQFIGLESQKRTLVGNAVCPKVSYRLAVSVLKILKKKVDTPKFIIHNCKNKLVFKEKKFDKPPKRMKNSKCRRHLFKKDGFSINLSNFNIEQSGPVNGKWFFRVLSSYSVKKIIRFNKKRLSVLEKELRSFSSYSDFKKDFKKLYKNIPTAKTLQNLYENNNFRDQSMNPDKLIKNLEKIISNYAEANDYHLCSRLYFIPKNKILKRQLYSMYGLYCMEKAINKKHAELNYTLKVG